MIDPSVLLLGAAGGIVYSLKSIPEKLYKQLKNRVVYTVRVYQYDDLFLALEKWLYDKHNKQYRDVEASISDDIQYDYFGRRREDENKKTLTYKQETNSFILNYRGKKLVITKSKEKLDKNTSLKDLYFRSYIITGVKAQKAIDTLLREVMKYNEELDFQNLVKVYANNCYGEWYAPREVRVKPLDKVVLQKDLKEKLIADLNEFSESEKWYIDSSIPYKRGYGFYGPPGTGKTTLALGIAAYTKRNVCCMNLNCIEDDSRVQQMFSGLKPNSIVLLEDIDKVFSGRENVNTDSKITFSTLLNCLDGAFHRHGIITIITTNHIEKLDPALLRTGRIDYKIEVPKPGKSEVEQYLSIFYDREVHLYSYTKSLTMSDIQEICLLNKQNFDKAYAEITSI